MPRLITRIFSFLLQESHMFMIKKRARQFYDEETYMRLLPIDMIDEIEYKNDNEIFELRNLMHVLDGVINF